MSPRLRTRAIVAGRQDRTQANAQLVVRFARLLYGLRTRTIPAVRCGGGAEPRGVRCARPSGAGCRRRSPAPVCACLQVQMQTNVQTFQTCTQGKMPEPGELRRVTLPRTQGARARKHHGQRGCRHAAQIRTRLCGEAARSSPSPPDRYARLDQLHPSGALRA